MFRVIGTSNIKLAYFQISFVQTNHNGSVTNDFLFCRLTTRLKQKTTKLAGKVFVLNETVFTNAQNNIMKTVVSK